MKLTLEQSAPPDLLDLMWQAFFRERGRGKSFSEHFPWLADPSRAGAWLATLRDGTQAIAGLVVKRNFERTATAAIGLVCVRADRRGQGLSQVLISGTIREAQALGMSSLTLWTSKPSVYRKHGFEIRDPALFGWVSNTAEAAASTVLPSSRRVAWPDAAERQADNRGLPAFAVDAYRLLDGSGQAQAIVIVDASGPIVAEWRGNPAPVAHLLRTALPATWRLNALRGDPLIAELAGNGFDVDLKAAPLQMWRIRADAAPTDLPVLRLLDRI